MCCYLHLSGTCNHVFAYDELQIGHIFDGKLLPGMAHVLSHSEFEYTHFLFSCDTFDLSNFFLIMSS